MAGPYQHHPLTQRSGPPGHRGRPAAPVSIAKCASYDEDITATLGAMFDQLGGLEKLVAQQNRHHQTQHDRQPRPARARTRPRPHPLHPPQTRRRHRLSPRDAPEPAASASSKAPGPSPDPPRRSDARRRLESPRPPLRRQRRRVRKHQCPGPGKTYARLTVPGSAYMYPAYDLNRAFDDTDVFVSMAKLKNHDTCGVTLSLKNCFGNLPASIYGDDSGVDEPNETPKSGRLSVGHNGKRRPAKSAPQELHFGVNHDPGYRVPTSSPTSPPPAPSTSPSSTESKPSPEAKAPGSGASAPSNPESSSPASTPSAPTPSPWPSWATTPAPPEAQALPEMRQHPPPGGSPRSRNDRFEADRCPGVVCGKGDVPLRVACRTHVPGCAAKRWLASIAPHFGAIRRLSPLCPTHDPRYTYVVSGTFLWPLKEIETWPWPLTDSRGDGRHAPFPESPL